MKRAAALFLAAAMSQTAFAQPAPQAAPDPRPVTIEGNPILSDGDYYSADPAPVVDGDIFYILAGRDEAPAGVNDFIMKEWQLLAASDPASGMWVHYPQVVRPENVFAWAEPNRAYASQIVKGVDGRFYFYAPVIERDSDAHNRFSIGVAVADDPRGPWTDAHPEGPIISQRVPVPNDMENIDPTVLVQDDGRVFIYWGTFGNLRAMELEGDMVTPKTAPQTIEGLTGFFEAPWIMRRKGVYYMVYAANNPGPDSPCTPAVYHACQAYATATDPMGPFTWRGTILKPVSSTTSHAGIVEFKGDWYIAYHTADAQGGGHFRRSVAVDRVRWDDSVLPPAILPVTPTRAPAPPAPPTRNIAKLATAAASNEPIPVQFWIKALNDGKVRQAPLPPDVWGTWSGDDNPPHPWIEYRWDQPVTLNGTRIQFWADQPAGADIGVAPPADWHLEYWAKGKWRPVAATGAYPTTPDTMHDIAFEPVTTRCLRAVFDASGTQKTKHAGVAVQEWEALRPEAGPLEARSQAAAGSCDN